MDESLTNVCFKDTAFLQAYGLTEFSVLDYFAQSQFYDPSCINEQIKMQARFNDLEAEQLDRTQMTGVEFELWYFTAQPSYFVIRKNQRYSPSKEGAIFKAPLLSSVLKNRLTTSMYYLNKAFDRTRTSTLYHPGQGYRWTFDEPLIRKARQDFVQMTNSNKLGAPLLTISDQQRQFDFSAKMEKVIGTVFEAIPKVSFKTEISSVEAVESPIEPSKATVADKPKKRKREKTAC